MHSQPLPGGFQEKCGVCDWFSRRPSRADWSSPLKIPLATQWHTIGSLNDHGVSGSMIPPQSGISSPSLSGRAQIPSRACAEHLSLIMTVFLHDIVMFVLGVVMCIPWVAVCVHYQNVYYGFSDQHKITFQGWVSSIGSVLCLAACVYGSWVALSALQHAMLICGWPARHTLSNLERMWSGAGATGLCTLAIWKAKQHRFRKGLADDMPGCAQCGYSLRGLPIVSGSIRCPECGGVQSIREIINRYRAKRRKLEAVDDEPWVA